MVWVAVLYAIVGTFMTDWLGRPLVRLNFDRQRYEADFRFSLVRFRENTEGVALHRGETDEFRSFRQRFEDVVGNWWGIMRRQKRMTYFTSGYGLGAWIVPSIVAPQASELILPIALAVQNQLTVDHLALTFSVYPSLSGSITEAGRQLMRHDDLD